MAASPDTSGRKNMLLLIQLRWMAVAGQIVTIVVVQFGLGIPLPLVPMGAVLGALVMFNIVSRIWLHNRSEVDNKQLLLELMVDVAALTAQLFLSGGAANPFTFLYLLQVTLAVVLLDTLSAWAVVALTCACFILLTGVSAPLQLPSGGIESLFTLHIAGMLLCFIVDAALLALFTTRITRNLRERDTYLAALREHAVEEDHIVRMGLLASGAAHELGTPLASLSVILGDWRHMPKLMNDPEIAQEIFEMQASLARCKTIVTGILMSAGEARGEQPAVTSVGAFLRKVVDEWRRARSATTLFFENAITEDIQIVVDTTLEQVVFNVLDNAYEVSPDRVHLSAYRNGPMLVLRITDAGPGFPQEMLAQFGKPYQSSKGRPGGGLGLFLVVNVVRKLGGIVTARNQPEGGAVVKIELPLKTLMINGGQRAA
ncbi:MAG TPA: ATP-binding protein [Devosiaceae bacterium]|nr:ATP-binding protein [Devosiaceae bacterium]